MGTERGASVATGINALIRNLISRFMTPLLNLAMRGLGLVGRFGLTIYITKAMGLEAMGAYGLVLGAISIIPAVIGFGLNYYVNREIIGEPLDLAIRKVRDRMAFTIVLSVIAVCLGFLAERAGWISIPQPMFIIFLIIIGECFAFDMHYFLISLGHSVAANALLFLRTTIWVFPLVIVGYLYPQTRVINALWYAWLGGLGLYFVCLTIFMLRWPLKSFRQEGFHFEWVFQNITHGKMIYFNDLCVVGLMFSDRFIINHFLGLKRAGQYVYFLSFGYAIYNLCLTSISQIYTPKMVLFFKNNDIQNWKKTITYATTMSVVFSVISSVFIFGLLFYLNRKLAMAGGSGLFILFPIICLFSTLKIVSETFNFGIYAMKRDRLLSYINIFSFVLNSIFMMVGIFTFGEIGLASGMAAAALITVLIRWYVLRHFEAILTAGNTYEPVP